MDEVPKGTRSSKKSGSSSTNSSSSSNNNNKGSPDIHHKDREFMRRLHIMLNGIERKTNPNEDILIAAFIICSPKYVSDDRLIRTVRREIKEERFVLGALRFIGLWTKSSSSNLSKRTFRSLCRLALSGSEIVRKAPQELRVKYHEEINRLKLSLLAGAKLRKTRVPNPAESSAVLSSSDISPALLAITERRITSVPDKAVSSPLLSPKQPTALGNLMQLRTADIADILLFINYDLFSRIGTKEFFVDRVKHPKRAPNLCAFINRNTRITQWVASSVLVQRNVETQRKVVNKFVEVANFCKDKGDAASCVSIMHGFAVATVSRLNKTWHLPSNRLAFARLCDALGDPKNNFGALNAYIRERMNSRTHCVPHLMGYQKVLALIEEGNRQDREEDGTVIVDKMVLIGNQLCDIQHFTRVVPKGFEASAPRRASPIYSILRLLPARETEQFEELSKKHKPYTTDAPDESSGPWSSDASSSAGVNDESSSSHSESYVDV